MLSKTRIAPSPSGYLHEGNLFAFSLNWLMARKEGLQILLRIDDLDQARYRPEYLEDIFRSLEAIGIDYDQGPQSVSEFESDWSQVKRQELYRAQIARLLELDLVFACSCSRKEITARSKDGFYDGFCDKRNLKWSLKSELSLRWRRSEGSLALKAWKQVEKSGALAGSLKQVVLFSKDQHSAYQLSSLMDDLHFGVSHILRGQDLFDSSIAQSLLAEDLDLLDFRKIHFHHHPLIKENGIKLSKSKEAPAAQIYLEKEKQQLLLNQLAQYLDLPSTGSSLSELLAIYKDQK